MKRNTSVPTRAADMENRTGQKSAARIGIEEAGGTNREGAGGGEGEPGRAAARGAGHWCSLGKLTKRLGAFEPAASAVVAVERKPEPLRADLPGWDDYIAA